MGMAELVWEQGTLTRPQRQLDDPMGENSTLGDIRNGEALNVFDERHSVEGIYHRANVLPAG